MGLSVLVSALAREAASSRGDGHVFFSTNRLEGCKYLVSTVPWAYSNPRLRSQGGKESAGPTSRLLRYELWLLGSKLHPASIFSGLQAMQA